MRTPCGRISNLAAASLVIGILGVPGSVHADYVGAVTNTPGLQLFWLLDESGTPAQSVDLISGRVATHMKGFPTNAAAGGPVSAPGPRPSDGFAGMPAFNNALQYTISEKHRSFVEIPDEVGGKSFAAGDMTGLTMECWYKRDNTNDEGVIFGYHDHGHPRYGFSAVLIRDGDNQPPANIRVYNKDADGRQTAYTSDTPVDTDWHHLTMTWDGKYFKTFIDGDESERSVSSSSGGASGAIKSLDEFVFGGDASSQNIRYFEGTLDKMAVYDRPLTAAQVARHYQAAVSGSYTMPFFETETLALQPCHLWRFEEPYGTSVLDSIGNWTCTARGSLFKLGDPGPRPPAYQGFDTGNCAATFVRTNGCGAFITNSIIDTLAPGQVFSQGTVTSLTMSVWFRFGEEGPSNVRQIIAGFQRKTGNRYSFMVCRESTGALKPYLADYDGEQQLLPEAYPNITDNDWHHFVMTWDGAALRTYLDGGDEKAYTDVNVSGALRASDGFYIGMDSNNGNYFEGQIDEVALFNSTLTAEQVLSLYRAAKRGKPIRGTIIKLTAAESANNTTPGHT